MKKDLIEKYKQLKKDLSLKREEMIQKRKRLDVLKRDPIVRGYLELEKECDCEVLSEEEIDNRIYNDINYEISETNNIYVCFGKGYSGCYENGKLVLCCPIPDEKRVSCAYYKNLENWHDGYIIKDEECEEFEKNHIVIHGLFHEISAASIKEYEKLSKKFINDILRLGNEEAVKRVLSKYN